MSKRRWRWDGPDCYTGDQRLDARSFAPLGAGGAVFWMTKHLYADAWTATKQWKKKMPCRDRCYDWKGARAAVEAWLDKHAPNRRKAAR